jgi:transcriptional regulator with PAS, ATPase and Fis domain
MLASRILNIKGLEKEVKYYRTAAQDEFSFEQIIGVSDSIRKVKEIAGKVALTESTVFILGESGTGKELLAKAIHYGSNRSRGPFIPVNCAAIPGEIVESELFGHKRGAFTGAVKDRVGKFQAADEGTIFLDEIGDMSLDVQAKILRVLEERTVTPVGGNKSAAVDVRIISATNKNIQKAVAESGFREDLYYRLNVVPLTLPPLRQRKEDIADLVRFFIHKFTHKDAQIAASEELIDHLTVQPWPGNVRELRNLVERMLIFKQGNTLDLDTLPAELACPALETNTDDWIGLHARKVVDSEADLHSVLEHVSRQIEIETIHLALRQCRANISSVAGVLGLSRQSIHEKLKKHKISLEGYR